MKKLLVALALSFACIFTAQAGEQSDPVARGRYLVQIAGCNDCHTPGYMASDGDVAEENWLLGDTLGWRGPWGTTYALNLRRYMAGIDEKQWLALARSVTPRPPMPWYNLRAMTDADLLAIYRFARSLGPPGEPAPPYLPPDQEPEGPYAQFP